ncbi:MAG: CDC27 family protein [bacterium]
MKKRYYFFKERDFLFIVFLFLYLTSLTLPARADTLSEVFFSEGMLEFSEGNYEHAQKKFKKAVEYNPKDADNNYYLGLSYDRIGEPQKSFIHLKQAVDLNPEREGIHFELGLVCVKLEKFEEAVQELNKAKGQKQSPSQTQYIHYYLGFAYYKTGKIQEAKKEFQTVKEAGQQTEVVTYAAKFLDSINKTLEERRPVNVSFSLTYEYDNNVSLEPLANVSTNISSKGDSKGIFTFKLGIDPIWTDNWRIGTYFYYYDSKYGELHAYNMQGVSPTVYLAYSQPNLYQLHIQHTYSYFSLEDEHYLKLHCLTPILTIFEGHHTMTQLKYTYQNKDFAEAIITDPDHDSRDAKNNGGGIFQYLFFLDNKIQPRIGYEYDQENTIGTNYDYDGHKYSLGIKVIPFWELEFDLNGHYYLQDYNHVHSTYGKKREDEVWNGDITLARDFGKHFRACVGYSHTRSDSNCAEYDYEKDVFSTSFEMRY